jgi:hypothetical protein
MNQDRVLRAARLRDYFHLQILMAERMAKLSESSIAETALRFTNLHRRFGLGNARGGSGAPEWTAYAQQLEALGTTDARVAWTERFFAAAKDETRASVSFGCFTFEPPDTSGVVRIHFSNRDTADGVGPLARTKVGKRQGDLARLFAYVKAQHPEATAVKGTSWLYNLDAYRRLFPPAYVASRSEPDRVNLDGTSTWGQALDHRDGVRPEVRVAVLRNLNRLDVLAPWRAFPLRALNATAPIEVFHQFYRRADDE